MIVKSAVDENEVLEECHQCRYLNLVREKEGVYSLVMSLIYRIKKVSTEFSPGE